MKKYFILPVVALAILSSCNNGQTNNAQADEDTTAVKSFEQSQIEANIKVTVDSLAAEFAKKERMPYFAAAKEGKLILSEEDLQVKPDYLISPAATNDLVTLSQKYRAVAMLSVDKVLLDAYKMPTDETEAAIQKLIVDIDDPAFKAFMNDSTDKPYKEKIMEFYSDEEANGRINFFWEAATAMTIEEVFAFTKNKDNGFVESIDDEAASNITYRFAILQNCLEQLKAYAPELESLCTAIKPLEKLNAISVDQLKQQLAEINDDLVSVREGLLK